MQDYNEHKISIIYGEKIESYKLNGVIHRIGGPAHVGYDAYSNTRSENWFENGKRHRLNKPAWIIYDEVGNGIYEAHYVFGVFISKEDFYTPGFVDSFILQNS